MINGLSGRPGAGKTYECVVTHILPALKDGRKIVTNIPLNIDWFVSVIGAHVRDLIVLVEGGFHNYGENRYFSTAGDFLVYDTWRNEKNQGVYFFVDEAHLSMPAGGTDKAMKEYLSMHRHYGHDIMLLTQNFRKVDRDVRDMVQTCYLCTKLSFLGKDDSYVCKVADGVSRNILVTHNRKYDAKYFAAYQSHTKSSGSVKEQATADVKKWHQRWTTRGAIALFLFGFLMLGSNLSAERTDHQAQAQKKLDEMSKATKPVFDPQPITSNALGQQQQPVSHSQPATAQPEEKKKKTSSHPFSDVSIHLTGYYADFNNRGKYGKVYYFTISRNGQALAEMTNADLVLAGYNVKIFNHCAAELTYGDFSTFVLCDTPTQSVTLAGDQLASVNN